MNPGLLTLDPQGGLYGGIQPIIALPHQPEHCAFGSFLMGSNLAASGTWTNANQAVIYPFYVAKPCTVYKIGWYNGSAAGGNACAALYNADTLARLVTTTATARAGNSTTQFVDTADTALVPNQKYYAAISQSTTTANHVAGLAAASSPYIGNWLLAGLKVQASVGTLPDPLVPADPAATVLLPLILLSMISGSA